MRKVFKYSFPTTDAFSLHMPKGAKIVLVEPQESIDPTLGACLWAEVNPEAPQEQRTFRLFGTGHVIADDNLVHVGSYQHSVFVWHLYEELK